jgi:hypothetical protein
MKFKAKGGTEHDVSDAFGAIEPVAGMSDRELREVGNRRRILDKVVEALDGADPGDYFPGKTIGDIGGQVWQPDTCNCRFLQLTLRTRGVAPSAPVAHRALAVCAAHAAGTEARTDPDKAKRRQAGELAHGRVLAENQHKNQSLQVVAEAAGVEPQQIGWQFAADRTLEFIGETIPADKRQQATQQLAAHVQARGKAARIV